MRNPADQCRRNLTVHLLGAMPAALTREVWMDRIASVISALARTPWFRTLKIHPFYFLVYIAQLFNFVQATSSRNPLNLLGSLLWSPFPACWHTFFSSLVVSVFCGYSDSLFLSRFVPHIFSEHARSPAYA